MQIPSGLRKKVADCINSSMSLAELQVFTSVNDFGLKYDQVAGAGTAPKEGIPVYVERLNANGTILDFIKKIIVEKDKNPTVQELNSDIQKLYENDGTSWKRKREPFECMLVKQNLPFLDRTEFREALLKMVNGDSESVIVLYGKPRSGVSYIRWYLSEIADNCECFEFLYLNLQDIGNFYPNELVSAAHIADVISSKLGMDYTIDLSNKETFKLQPFLNKLKSVLNTKAKEHVICLLCIDQFNEPFSQDIKYLIDGLANLITLDNGKSYLVLSGYKHFKNWPFELLNIAEPVDIDKGSFKREQVELFLEHIYSNPLTDFQNKINKKTFIASAIQLLPDDLFTDSDEPNVTAIGQKLTVWYKEIRKKLAS